MKGNKNRKKEIFKDVIPAFGSKEYNDLMSSYNRKPRTKEEKKFIKNSRELVVNSLEAQFASNCNFITELTLRHFLHEFNYRAWEHGLRSMPIMFNIMESYFIYRKPHIYFELIEEENYILSLFDFLEFITSNQFKEDIFLINNHFEEDLIYNINIGSDLQNITFRTTDNIDFIITGLSIIRRKEEVTVLLITGSKNKKTVEKIDPEFETHNPNKVELLETFVKKVKDKNQEQIYIDEAKEYSKTLVVCRINLENQTIDARYTAEEFENLFTINTDESDGFRLPTGDFISQEHEEIYEESIKTIEKYNAIFEIAQAALYLPYYLSLNEDKLIEELHETEFKKISSSPRRKRKFKNTYGQKSSTKPFYILNLKNKISPDIIKYRDDLFKIENSGHWKKLGIDEIGQDRKGNPIHGKTWVNTKKSWFQATQDQLIIEKKGSKFTNKNAGNIYIIRNPTMGKNIFKIGLTRKEVEQRVKQLSNTSVPDSFHIAQEWHVRDCVLAEKKIHETLSKYRVDPRREFFQIEYQTAVKVISQVCNEINGA